MDKWTVICIIGVILGLFSPLVISEYSKGQCKAAAMTAGYSADDVLKLCK
jgi:hypothetical protein